MTNSARNVLNPGWIYGMVIGFLGAALLALVIAMVIASLTGSRPSRPTWPPRRR